MLKNYEPLPGDKQDVLGRLGLSILLVHAGVNPVRTVERGQGPQKAFDCGSHFSGDE